MPLYGNELGPDTTPYDAGLGRVVKFDKPGGFVGAAALDERAQATPDRVLAGLTMASRRVPRHGYTVLAAGQPCRDRDQRRAVAHAGGADRAGLPDAGGDVSRPG